MTRDDIRKKLIYNQNQIGNIRTTINEQESQIENLEGLRNSFNRLLYDFNYKHNMQNARISDINNMSYINSKNCNFIYFCHAWGCKMEVSIGKHVMRYTGLLIRLIVG